MTLSLSSTYFFFCSFSQHELFSSLYLVFSSVSSLFLLYFWSKSSFYPILSSFSSFLSFSSCFFLQNLTSLLWFLKYFSFLLCVLLLFFKYLICLLLIFYILFLPFSSWKYHSFHTAYYLLGKSLSSLLSFLLFASRLFIFHTVYFFKTFFSSHSISFSQYSHLVFSSHSFYFFSPLACSPISFLFRFVGLFISSATQAHQNIPFFYLPPSHSIIPLEIYISWLLYSLFR